MQVLIQPLGIRVSELLIGKDLLHYIILVLPLDKTAFDSEASISAVFPSVVGDFLHPNALLPLIKISTHLQIPIYRG